jgi:hypothetical protein
MFSIANHELVANPSLVQVTLLVTYFEGFIRERSFNTLL